MTPNQEKLVATLKYIFQIDRGDLDFGIYRILNQKHAEISDFLENKLLTQVNEVLSQYSDGDRVELQNTLDAKIREFRDNGFSDEQIEDNNIIKDLRAKLAATTDVAALESEVFSHLVHFFERYYEEGDFISKRRYKEGVYAIPYEGEEVKLHWANHDQYYIKTSEQFRNYTFKAGDKKVHFKIKEAETDRNNNKSQKDRRFVLSEETPFEEVDGELNIHFHYVGLDEKKKQDDLNKEAVGTVLDTVPDVWKELLSTSAPTEKQADRTLLEKHLTTYTAKYTFDYFIHKDLGTFLKRELDFFIKNEIVHLDDIENETAPRAEQYLAKVKAVRKIAGNIITMLAQLEDFQKKLWEKKKFVVGTGYCITLDLAPEQHYEAILQNDAQLASWKELGFVDDDTELSVEYLKDHPTLTIDTKYFPDIKDELLATFENIDDAVNGVLINSENFGALNILQETYQESVQGVHIDPPYNTDTSGFLYKNSFKNSSWLAMKQNRLSLAKSLLSNTGSIQCHIDENEYERLSYLFDTLGLYNSGTVIWDKKNPIMGTKGVATRHEYVIWRSKSGETQYLPNQTIKMMLEKAAEIISMHGGVNEEAKREYYSWVEQNNDLTGGEKAYKYIDDEGRIYRGVALGAPEYRSDPKFHIPLMHPVTGRPCPVPPNGFSRTPETLNSLIDNDEILFGEDETTQPNKKLYLTEDSRRQFPSVLEMGAKGKADINPLGLEFPYNHPVEMYAEFIGSVTLDKKGCIMDYFAGSGTTGHAVLRLNWSDNEVEAGSGQRKYIMVEMGEYFETVTKPRMLKVVYSDDWSNGKPQDHGATGTPKHVIKYFKLESYEDTLNNLELKRNDDQEQALQLDDNFYTEYMLRYQLDVEARESLLSLETFRNPFAYTIKLSTDVVGEMVDTPVDLVETFNYLIGLKVATIQTHEGIKVVEGENLAGEKILVLWRNIDEVDNDALNDFFNRQALSTTDFEFQKIYVNGDNTLENLRQENDGWKVVLIEEEFKKRMFNE